jgi:hypothetical protein
VQEPPPNRDLPKQSQKLNLPTIINRPAGLKRRSSTVLHARDTALKRYCPQQATFSETRLQALLTRIFTQPGAEVNGTSRGLKAPLLHAKSEGPENVRAFRKSFSSTG